jgi:hypothetical protein
MSRFDSRTKPTLGFLYQEKGVGSALATHQQQHGQQEQGKEQG